MLEERISTRPFAEAMLLSSGLLKNSFAAVSSFLKRMIRGTRKKAVFYYASSSLVCQCLRFLGVLITTRAIVPEQFGLLAQATLLISIAGLCREIGQSGALVAYQGTDFRYVFFNFQLNLFLGLCAAAIVFGSLLTPQIVPNELRQHIWLLAAIPLVDSLTSTNSLMLQKLFRFKVLGVAEIFSLFVWLVTICLTIGRAPGFLVLLLAQFAEGICRCLLLFAIAGWQFTGVAAGKDLSHYYFYRFARPVIPLVVLQSLLARSDFLLLSVFSTTRELGTYERLGQFSRIPTSLTVNLCDKVLMHSYSHSQNDLPVLRSLVEKSMLLIMLGVILITSAVTIGLVIFLKPLVGADWARLIMNLWWFGIPVLLMTPILFNTTLFLSGLGMQVQLLRNSALNLLTDLVFGLPLVAAFGARGMLLAKSLSGACVLGYQAHVLHRKLALLTPFRESEHPGSR